MSVIYLTLLLAACQKAATPEATPTPIPEVNKNMGATPLPDPHAFYVAPNGNDNNPGTLEMPWATPNHAAQVARAGDTVYFRDGIYRLEEPIRVKNSGTENAWIVFRNYLDELAVFDAKNVPVGLPGSASPYPQDQGAFLIQGVNFIRAIGLAVRNSHNAGFTIRDSSNVELYNNLSDTTFSSGIAAWDTNHQGVATHDIRIIGNTITHATTWAMLPAGMKQEGEPPHEAISIGGAVNFEVAYNLVYDDDKEGIDVKETSQRGRVHHNYIHDVARQGLYVDSWFGTLADVEVDHNVVHNCAGAGIIVSVEGGQRATDIRIHHNLVYNNQGTGILFSRWGDGPRSQVKVYNNTVYHNGWGTPNPGEQFFWITGGLYLYSANLSEIDIRNNIFSDNRAFQIGYSDYWMKDNPNIRAVFDMNKITIAYNLINDRNNLKYPLHVGWPPDNYSNAFAFDGVNAVSSDPKFVDPSQSNFYLQNSSPAIHASSPESIDNNPDGSRGDIGAFFAGEKVDFWWLQDFPPKIEIP